MKDLIPHGVWPTMITPFSKDNKVDFAGLEALIEWYYQIQVAGLFAVCQSSEMQYLSLSERVEIATFVKSHVGDKLPVVASGHIADSVAEQIEELKAMADTGVDALVLVTNRLAQQDQGDEVFRANAERIFDEIGDVPFGLYECPAPYKRLVSSALLRWCASTGRFLFLKDTSCDLTDMQDKRNAVSGSLLKIFNANAATLLESLRVGVSGYSGVMANFHPDLYVWLVRNWGNDPDRAKELQDFLGLASVIERQFYPINAKYHCQLHGLPVGLDSRAKDAASFTRSLKMEVEQLHDVSTIYSQRYAQRT